MPRPGIAKELKLLTIPSSVDEDTPDAAEESSDDGAKGAEGSDEIRRGSEASRDLWRNSYSSVLIDPCDAAPLSIRPAVRPFPPTNCLGFP